jgi:hypothetical protein
VDPRFFNDQLKIAHAEGQPWADDPIQVVSRLINSEPSQNAVWTFKETGERSGRYHVMVVVDGFRDDSLMGKRYEATIERPPNRVWQIPDASYSWRCWRSRSDVFGIDPCP